MSEKSRQKGNLTLTSQYQITDGYPSPDYEMTVDQGSIIITMPISLASYSYRLIESQVQGHVTRGHEKFAYQFSITPYSWVYTLLQKKGNLKNVAILLRLSVTSDGCVEMVKPWQ